jgi:hypothetical protein
MVRIKAGDDPKNQDSGSSTYQRAGSQDDANTVSLVEEFFSV